MSLFLVASAIQGFSIFVDEFFFHHKRGLPRWERIGHPIDTAMTIACFVFLVFVNRTPTTEWFYIAMAAVSCALVTKDEWIHHKYCTGGEMWLHAVLFLMHPLVLFAAYLEWDTHRFSIAAVATGVWVFLMYQIIYWNFIYNPARKPLPQPIIRKRPSPQEDLFSP